MRCSATACGWCAGCVTPTGGRSDRDATITRDARPGGPAGLDHRAVAGQPLIPPPVVHRNSVKLRAMHSATGYGEGHILALIAVGPLAVADVACCR
ncbi:Ms4533A family Cys-rich leader peptide [Mycobacterium sp. SA01]|uniref:Ms4533A family Cys-rich leader peptide n=1 Tax=Mycobacterium sp. SA01 TaxID=3238820 RepID=UPI00351AFBE0